MPGGDELLSTTLRGFAVHILTASGTALALLALVAATQHAWVTMFLILGIALVVDAIDGPLARRFQVKQTLPRWSGDTLDLVVDYLNYVFIPAYAIAASGLLPEIAAIPLAVIIVVTGALYFADTEMKMVGNYFRGFPTLWNAVAFNLFVVKPPPMISGVIIVLLAILTFVPFKFLHPVRVVRLRALNLSVLAMWSVLAAYSLVTNLQPEPWAIWGLVVCGLYLFLIGLTDGRTSG